MIGPIQHYDTALLVQMYYGKQESRKAAICNAVEMSFMDGKFDDDT